MCGRMTKPDAYKLLILVNEAYQTWTEEPDPVNLQLWHDAAENLARAIGHEIQLIRL